MTRTRLVELVKIGLSLALVGGLVWQATWGMGQGRVFAQLTTDRVDWSLLSVAVLAQLAATLLTFVRWWALLRAVQVRVGLVETVRVGFWGQVFNLAPLGIVSGDVAKMVLLSRERPEVREHVVMSVLVDRILGVYCLLVFALGGVFAAGMWQSPVPELRWVAGVIGLATLGVTVGLLVVFSGAHRLLPGSRVPLPGVVRGILTRLSNAWDSYRRVPGVLAGLCVLTMGIHALSAVTGYFIASGLPGFTPPFTEHFVIIPLNILAAIVPLPWGPGEMVLEALYRLGDPESADLVGRGLAVALVFRLTVIVTTALGPLAMSVPRLWNWMRSRWTTDAPQTDALFPELALTQRMLAASPSAVTAREATSS